MRLQDGETFIVVDAGGGTVDLTTYTLVTATPVVMEEVAPPDCEYVILLPHSRISQYWS